jgi:hypothetical protein
VKKIFLMPLAAVVILFASSTALGCVCGSDPIKPTHEQARLALAKDFNAAFAVFSGEVVESSWLKVKFKVDKVWKGDIGDELEMPTGVKDNGDGTFTTYSCDYRAFRQGEKYLVFTQGNSLAEMTVHSCSRTKPLASAGQELKNLDDIQPHWQRRQDSESDRERQAAPPMNFVSVRKRT